MADQVPVHQALAQAVYDNGVRELFGVLGDANLDIVNDFHLMPGAEYVGMAAEGGAVLAALGYAQVSGKLGVATVTHGPGLTNTVTGLVEAERARTPLLLIAGDTPAAVHDHIQDIDQLPIVLSTGAGFVQIKSAESAVADLATAMRRALAERLPIVANVPIDLLGRQVTYAAIDVGELNSATGEPSEQAVEDAVGAIAWAQRPLVLAGRGVATSGASAEVLALAERIGAPVATTLRGKGQFDGLPHNLGIFGSLSDELTTEVIGLADCVVALGCGLNPWTAGEGALLADKAVIHVDVDPGRLDRYSRVRVPIAGDAARTAHAIVRLLDEAEIPPTRFVETVVERKSKNVAPTRRDRGSDTTVDIRTALQRVDEILPADRIVVTDNGRFILTAFTRMGVEEPRLWAHAVSFGSIGLGLATAIGASYAEPGRMVVAVVGDGGFALGGLSDLVMAVAQHRRLVVVLLNDGAYGAEYVQLRNRGLDPSVATLTWPDFGPVAEAIGASGYTVRNLEELETALQSLTNVEGPGLLDVRIDPDQV